MDQPSQRRSARLARERADLAKAERDVVAGEMRVTRQMLRIEALRVGGHDTAQAERQLTVFEATLAEWNAHRAEILRTLEILRDG